MIARLAVRSVRTRAATHLATALVLLAGTTLLTGLGSVLGTGLAATGPDRALLILMPAILGGWAVGIVAFGTVSTVSLAVGQREAETALLRSIGATPRQVAALVVAETALVAAPVVTIGLLPGLGFGRLLLDRLVAAGAIGPVDLRIAVDTLVLGASVALLAALGGAAAAARRAAAVSPARALAAVAGAPSPGPLLSRSRRITGLVVVGIGLVTGLSTLAMPNGPLLSSTAGPAGVAVAVGLALLAPVPVAVAGWLATLLPGAVGRLAGRNLRARARSHGAAAGPLVLLAGIAGGTLAMQAIEDRLPAIPGPQLATVNYLVVLVITGFAAVAVTNTLLTATRGRRAEFATLRLAGATRSQVVALAGIESLVTAVVATVLGAAAVLVTVVPFGLVRGSWAVPGWLLPLVVLGTVALALAATVPTAWRLVRLS